MTSYATAAQTPQQLEDGWFGAAAAAAAAVAAATGAGAAAAAPRVLGLGPRGVAPARQQLPGRARARTRRAACAEHVRPQLQPLLGLPTNLKYFKNIFTR